MDREIGSGMVNGRVNRGRRSTLLDSRRCNRAGSGEKERETLAHALHVSRLCNRKLPYSPPVSSVLSVKAYFADLDFFRRIDAILIRYTNFSNARYAFSRFQGESLILFEDDESFGRGKTILYTFLNKEIKVRKEPVDLTKSKLCI